MTWLDFQLKQYLMFKWVLRTLLLLAWLLFTRGWQLGRQVYETPESDSDSGVNFEDSGVNIKDSGVNFKDSGVNF